MIATFQKTNHGLSMAVALFTGLGLVSLPAAPAETAPLAKDLLGTWVCVGRPGVIGAVPAAGGRIKLITEHEWSVSQADPHTGTMQFHHGGTWKLKENEYAETVTYANPNTTNFLNRTFTFTLKLDGDTLTLTGVGNPWNEVWKRVKTEALKPAPLDVNLQGKWTGKETSPETAGPSSLVIKGNTLEFHGGNPKEWYKASFSTYDTTPKQLVAVIIDCAIPEYKGRTTFAIWQLQAGALTVAANEPGDPTVPANFDAPGSRKIVFKKE